MWQAREDCLRDERGLGPSGLIGFDRLILDDEVDEAAEEAMRRQWQYEQEEFECAARGDTEGEAKARGKQETLRRLQRVEVIYVSFHARVADRGHSLAKLTIAEGDLANYATLRHRPAQAPPRYSHRTGCPSASASSHRWTAGACTAGTGRGRGGR